MSEKPDVITLQTSESYTSVHPHKTSCKGFMKPEVSCIRLSSVNLQWQATVSHHMDAEKVITNEWLYWKLIKFLKRSYLLFNHSHPVWVELLFCWNLFAVWTFCEIHFDMRRSRRCIEQLETTSSSGTWSKEPSSTVGWAFDSGTKMLEAWGLRAPHQFWRWSWTARSRLHRKTSQSRKCHLPRNYLTRFLVSTTPASLKLLSVSQNPKVEIEIANPNVFMDPKASSVCSTVGPDLATTRLKDSKVWCDCDRSF